MERTETGREGDDLRRRFHRHLRDRPELIPPGARVLVAVSGGPDSMALLDLLTRPPEGRDLPPRSSAGPAPRWSVVAAHFDHCLRPEAADEAERVVEWCRRRGVRWVAGGPARPLAPKPATCRRARYAFLDRVAGDVNAVRILTAHHADDQAETVLFRILRGTDLRGLRAMPALRDRLVRPLLPFRKRELRAYARERGLPYHEDPSNRDPAYARSRLRHRLLPALEARDPAVRGKLIEIGRLAAEADAAMGRLTERALAACRITDVGTGDREAIWLSQHRLRWLDRELQARVLRRVARARDVRLTRGGTRSAIQFINDARSGARMDLGAGLRLGRDFDLLWIGREEDEVGHHRPVSFGIPGEGSAGVRIGGAAYRVRWGGSRPGPETGGGLARRVAPIPEKNQLSLRVRGWRSGDRIRLATGTRKLKDVFVDRRVPRSLRKRLPVLAEVSGPVLWVPGLCGSHALSQAGTPERDAGSAEDGDGWWVIITRVGTKSPGDP